jgi:hypothetical protein
LEAANTRLTRRFVHHAVEPLRLAAAERRAKIGVGNAEAGFLIGADGPDIPHKHFEVDLVARTSTKSFRCNETDNRRAQPLAAQVGIQSEAKSGHAAHGEELGIANQPLPFVENGSILLCSQDGITEFDSVLLHLIPGRPVEALVWFFVPPCT